jgi:hypothetical protein
MRIEGPKKSSSISTAAPRRDGGSSTFALPDEMPSPTVRTGGASAPLNVSALIALQEVDAFKERRRKAVKRGFDLLDVLDEIRIDLLNGEIGFDRMEKLVVLLGNGGHADDPRVDTLMADIELRARVELAKVGRFPV